MSLLLDALQRASREKDQSAGTAMPTAMEPHGSMPTLGLGVEPTTAMAVEYPSLSLEPMQSVETPEPEKENVPVLELAQAVGMAAPVLEPAALELAGGPAPGATPASAAAQGQPPAVSAQEPMGTAFEEVAAPAQVAVPSSAAKSIQAERVAQQIRRAYASAEKEQLAQRRFPLRTVTLGAVAVVMASVGTVLMGVWGDPAQLLGLNGASGLAVGAANAPAATASAVAPPKQIPETPPPQPSLVAAQPSLDTSSETPPSAESTKVASSAVASKPRLSASRPDTLVARNAANDRHVEAQQAPSPSQPTQLQVKSPVAPVVAGTVQTDAGALAASLQQAHASPKSASVRSDMVLKSRGPSLVELAYAALAEGRLEEAQQGYQSALQARPEDRDALWGLAYLAQQRGDKSQARDYYRRVLRQDPGNAQASNALWALEADTMVDAPQQRAHDLVQSQPESASAWAAAATAMGQQGQWGQSAQWWARAQALEPRNPVYAFNHAVTLDRLRQYRSALQQYEQALRLSERRPEEIPLGKVRQRAQELRQALQSHTDE